MRTVFEQAANQRSTLNAWRNTVSIWDVYREIFDDLIRPRWRAIMKQLLLSKKCSDINRIMSNNHHAPEHQPVSPMVGDLKRQLSSLTVAAV
ncbi:hypothetical protein AB2I57_26100 (plasmid) [Escherichia coli]